MDKNKTITIYTTPWIDIRSIKDVLNHHLLKYKVIYIDDSLFRDVKNALPVVEIDDKYYYHLQAATIRELFGFTKDPDTNYVDLLIIGDSLENFMALDYAIKKGIDVAWLTSNEAHVEEYRGMYQRVYRTFSTRIYDYIHVAKPVLFSLTQNRKYIAYETDVITVYAKTALITLDHRDARIKIPGESRRAQYLHHERNPLLNNLKKRELTGGLAAIIRRVFIIAGDQDDILDEALRLHDAIQERVPALDFEIIVLGAGKLDIKSRLYKRFLRMQKNIRIVSQVHIYRIKYNGTLRRLIISTDVTTYTADYIYLYNKPKLNNQYIRHILPVDYDGYIKTDMHGKTLFGNIYALKALPGYTTIDPIQIMDLSQQSAACIRELDSFLLNH